ncbi:MAG: hypothetical protein PUB17_07580 [Lachnospiraceae bacterium]|nr:hypothetical protein [Lachnospiraceae bacterium]
MQPYEIVLLIIVAVIIIAIIGVIVSRSAKKTLYYKLLASFGQIPENDYSYEEYESISHFFRNTLKDEDDYIDDITWNDLDMDKIFMMIDNTHSSIGRDELYKLLRKPVTDRAELEKREKLIEYFDTHEKERTQIMMCFSKMGFVRKISVSDYMKNLFELKAGSNVFHYMMWVCIIIAVLYTFLVEPITGVMLIIAACGISIVTYYKLKSRIDSYFECIRQIVTMVSAAKEIKSLNIDELSEYNDFFDETVHRFAGIMRGSYIVVSGKQNNGSIGDVIMEYVKMFTHIDLIKFNSIIKNFSRNYEHVTEMMDTLGYIEAMISVASFRHLLPYMCTPEFTDDSRMKIKNVYHLAIKAPVANSIDESRPVLVTGSNASGKSTFLKSVAINALLAQTVHTCPAEEYSAPFYRIYSSMALADNIEAGESYYIVEIKSLKRIVDAAAKPGAKILCFIDEVLRGTNTVERIAASSEILKNLTANGVMCFAATHDIELTHILEDYYSNYHFTEEVEDDNVVFSYLLQKGRATSRNAIKLLKIIGYDDAITNNSKRRADDFINTGVWRKC